VRKKSQYCEIKKKITITFFLDYSVAEKSFHRERKQYMHLINAFEKF